MEVPKYDKGAEGVSVDAIRSLYRDDNTGTYLEGINPKSFNHQLREILLYSAI